MPQNDVKQDLRLSLYVQYEGVTVFFCHIFFSEHTNHVGLTLFAFPRAAHVRWLVLGHQLLGEAEKVA